MPTGIVSVVGFRFDGKVSTTRDRLEVNGAPAGGRGTANGMPAAANSTGNRATLEATRALVVESNDMTLTADTDNDTDGPRRDRKR